MRTTLDLDEDVLIAAYGLARQRGTTIGKVLSTLARQTLNYRDLVEPQPAPADYAQAATPCIYDSPASKLNEAR
jgi:hypothetical protein